MEERPAAETFQLCSWSHLCSPLNFPPAFPRQQLTRATSHSCRSPPACFSPAHILRSRVLEMDVTDKKALSGQPGRWARAGQRLLCSFHDNGRCGLTQGHRGFPRSPSPALPLPSWSEWNPTAVGAGVPGLVGDVLCSPCRSQPLNRFPISPTGARFAGVVSHRCHNVPPARGLRLGDVRVPLLLDTNDPFFGDLPPAASSEVLHGPLAPRGA